MRRYLTFFGFVFVTWVLHVILVTTYMKQFTDTHSTAFRTVYALELAVTFSLMILIYLAKIRRPIGLPAVLAITIGFLAIIDTVLSISLASVRTSFDIYHFLIAYTVTALTLAAVCKFKIK